MSGVGPADEATVPSYTFVSSRLLFVRQGCKILFADSMAKNPNIDAEKLEALVTPKTKVIVPVHYAGVACDMDAIMEIAEKYGLLVVEDAAQAVDSYYKGRPLGSIGHLAAFSFHETKNIIAGEGGLLAINDERFIRRAEIIWEKGTNRSEFFRGEVNKYGWVDTGSSFLPSEVISAFLWAQLEEIESIQEKRKSLWNLYFSGLSVLQDKDLVRLPQIPGFATNNAHMFYMVCRSLEERTALIAYLKERGVLSVFHYQSLHKSEFYKKNYTQIPDLPFADLYSDQLVRLPMYYELGPDQVETIVSFIRDFYAE